MSVQAILSRWSEQMARHPASERRTFARSRLDLLQTERVLLDRGDAQAIDRMTAARISAFDIPVIADWLAVVERTGNVPATPAAVAA